MRARLLAAALAGAALAAAPAPPAAAQQAQADWTRTVAATPEGGYRIGNPDAPVKVIEFVSLTCPHCAHFSAEAMPELVGEHVKSGRVSFELRNYFLNGIDLVASLVSRCAAPDDYFALSAAILAEQPDWVGRIQALGPEAREEIGALGPMAGMVRVAREAGLDAIAARHGVGADALAACLADPDRAETLVLMQQAAERDFGVDSTPSFAVNGRLVPGVHDWSALEPLLEPPGSGGS